MKDVCGGIWLGAPKTPRSRRIVLLAAMMVESLRRHRVNQTVERLKHSAGWNPNNIVFCTSRGTAFSQSNFHREYYIPLLQKAGLLYIRPHDNRHTNTSTHLKQGTPIHKVQTLVGHTSATTPLSIYAHVMPGMNDQARDRIERAFAANPE
jgi:integrase